MRNIIPEFTKPEIDYIIENANFTEQEKTLFHMRNNEHPLEECAELMNMSVATVYRRNKKMINKIMRVIRRMDI